MRNNEFYYLIDLINYKSIEDIKLLVNNLPFYINHLYFGFFHHGLNFDGVFENLPVTLKKLVINYNSYSNFKNLEECENRRYFNILFGIKLPFGCEVFIQLNIGCKCEKFKVIYQNNNLDELTLHNIKTNNKKIIKKVKNLDYVIAESFNCLNLMHGTFGLSYSD
jgi:hypothetical protein